MDLTLENYISDEHLIAQDIVKQYMNTAKTLNTDYFSFIRFHDDYVDSHLDEFASRPLKAAPI
jgi:hypothetical protein